MKTTKQIAEGKSGRTYFVVYNHRSEAAAAFPCASVEQAGRIFAMRFSGGWLAQLDLRENDVLHVGDILVIDGNIAEPFRVPTEAR